MRAADLGYVGLGLHELLVAYVADQEDYFAQAGVHVALRDARRWPTERLRRIATIGLGRAQVSRLRDGVPWTVLSVNTDRPLFWILGRGGLTTVEDLAGRRLAVHPPASGPGIWARIVLRRHGLDPDADVRLVVREPGDYSRDLAALRAGDVDAALVGSTLLPEATAREEGLAVVCFVGDELRIPTTGVAVDPTHLAPDDPAVRAVVSANVRALRTLRDDPDLARRHIRALVPRLDDAQAARYYERYVRPGFTADGREDPAVVDEALAALAAELGAPEPPRAADVYRTGPSALAHARR